MQSSAHPEGPVHRVLRFLLLVPFLITIGGCAAKTAGSFSPLPLAEMVEALDGQPAANQQRQVQASPDASQQESMRREQAPQPPVINWTQHDPNDTF